MSTWRGDARLVHCEIELLIEGLDDPSDGDEVDQKVQDAIGHTGAVLITTLSASAVKRDE